MTNDIEKICKLEEIQLHDRKSLIIEKMDCYYAYNGVTGTDVFLDFLKVSTTFKYGTVADFENFKKEYLLSFDDLKKFNDIYYNSAWDVDELLYFGFDGKMKVVSQMEFYESVYEEIMNYDFAPSVLNDFEAYVNDKFKEGCL